MSLQSDVYGQTQNITIPIPPFSVPEYLHNINDIKDINCEAINVLGGATGNNFFPPYRNNSIVNIGETELSPGILNIYGVNAELTTALSVYGLTSLNGDTTINGLNTVNGITDLNGDCTVLGFLDVGGTLDVAGITTITGATNIGGVLTVEGETNIAGLLTAEAGIGIVGATTIQLGDITIGNSGGGPTNNYNLYNYYNGTIVSNLTVNGVGDFRRNTSIGGNLYVGGVIYGTVVSGSESISTLNVSTLRAYNISSITNTTEEFFVSSIAGYSNRTIHFNNDIVVPSISTTTLNMINGTGNQLVLRQYADLGPTLGFNRKIDGIDFLDGVIGSAEDVGFIVAGFSTINVVGLNNVSIKSDENVLISASNAVNISTPIFFVENAGFISSIYTNYISTSLIESRVVDLYSQDIENPIAAVAFSRNIDGEKVGDSSIAIDNVNGFQIASVSTMRITAVDDMLIASQGNTVLFNENSNIILSAPETIIPFNLSVSTLNTEQISSFNTFAYNLIGSNLAAGNIFTENINALTISTGSFTSVVRAPSVSTNTLSTNSIRANSIIVNSNLTVLGNGINTADTVTVGLRTSSITSYYPSPENNIGIDGNINLQGNILSNTFLLQSSNISTNLISTGRLLSGLNITTPALSTTTISSATIFANFITAPVNVNFGKNVIPSGNLDLGASGAFRWNNFWVSTISSIHTQTSTLSATNTITASTIAIDRIVGNASATNIFTNNLFPLSAGAQLGYNSAGTGGGGFYNILAVRSTFTQVINPSGEAGRFSNAVYINTNLSTQNVMVSSINNKLYPYTSTLNIPFSSFAINGNAAGTPILLYSNVDFRTQGFHRISQKAILSKNSGGSSADIHANIFYSVGAFPSTPSITDGYSALPMVNQDNASTFTTLYTEFYVSTPTTRSIYYYDSTANNYTSRLYMGTLFDTFTPDLGNNPTRIPNIL